MGKGILKVDLPEYVTAFLCAILDKLRESGFLNTNPDKTSDNTNNSFTIRISTKTKPYCYDGIELIKKTLSRKGINCSLMKYEKEKGGVFVYEFLFTKKKKIITFKQLFKTNFKKNEKVFYAVRPDYGRNDCECAEDTRNSKHSS